MSRAAAPAVRREVGELELLFAVSRLLDRSLELDDVAAPLLALLARHLGLRCAALTLRDAATGESRIEAAFGLSAAQRRRGRYRPGEGVTGEVIAAGRPAVVPHLAADPRFLNRTGARAAGTDGSFVCVPIRDGRETVGALSLEREVADTAVLENDARLLAVVASLIAQAVRLRRTARAAAQELRAENERLQAQLRERWRPDNLIGMSTAMQAVYDQIAQVAESEATVLLRGESGTGKELVAQAIHARSPRARGPLVMVNCAALPETLIESELFGHEAGAFTGALAARRGRCELAAGGTLVLDEIGDLPAALQAKLLRVLQERTFERVGGTRTLTADVRVLAATNRDLETMVADGAFRADLYYRLNVFPMFVPPLRQRVDDILPLADHFVERYGRRAGHRVRRISTSAIDMLMAYHWPGNVRELENCIQRAVLLSTDGVIHGHHLPPTLQTAEASGTLPRGTLRAAVAALERELIQDALKSSGGNCTAAARALGLTAREIGVRVHKYGIDPRRFRRVRRGDSGR